MAKKNLSRIIDEVYFNKKKLDEKKSLRFLKERYFGSEGVLQELTMDKIDCRDFIYNLRDRLLNLVDAGLVSRADLKIYYSKIDKGDLRSGLISTILYLSSQNFKEMAESTEIGFSEKYGFLACKGEINDLSSCQGRFSELNYSENSRGNSLLGSTIQTLNNAHDCSAQHSKIGILNDAYDNSVWHSKIGILNDAHDNSVWDSKIKKGKTKYFSHRIKSFHSFFKKSYKL